MKKAVILITRLDLGGAQEVALETAARLDPKLFDVRLLAGPGGALDPEAQKRLGESFVSVPSLIHPIKPLQDLLALVWLWRYFVKERIQVVHTHSSKAGLVGRVAAWLARVPLRVHTVHGWSFNDTQSAAGFKVYVWLERILAKLTHSLAVVAQSCREKGLLNGVGQPDQYVVLHAAVDRDLWAKTPRPRRSGEQVVGCIANCKEQKNPLDFVRVAALVPKARFVYVGDGPLRPDAEALAKELGISRRVKFLGWQREPRNLSAGFDVFLLTSLYEGLPCVFPQVLAQGVPVVATSVDGAAEIVKEGVNGYLCQPRDVEALASRVRAILKDGALRRRLSAAAKRSVPKEFTFESMVARTSQIYGGAA